MTAVDPTNANTALASAFAEELARGGMRHAVVSPGSRNTPLAVALWRQPEIEVTVIVDERSAGFFALGAAQASGAPVAVLCTSGTAAANYHPAVCEADESGTALIVLSADRPPELRGIGAGQTIDQVKLFGADIWSRRRGFDLEDDNPARTRPFDCDRRICAARTASGDRLVLWWIHRTPAGAELDELCRNADIVVIRATAVVPTAACAGKFILTGEQFAGGGSAEIYREPRGWRVAWAQESRGSRPWSGPSGDD